MRPLGDASLRGLPAEIRRPGYNRAALEIGMAHLGVGAFHRCHQAEFTDDMLEARFGRWGVVGINLKPPRIGAMLGRQDGLYSRTLRHDEHAETRVIGSLKAIIEIEDAGSLERAVEAVAQPSLSVVTMTVTEKGYCHIPATGALDIGNPLVRADLETSGIPATTLGLLALALERRRSADSPGITLLSCDNIPSNGHILRSVLLAFAAARSAPLARWIEARVAFPCSMVDRIVPATTPEDAARAGAALGLSDDAPVVGEPFRQWVIEDQFAGERPPWDLAGAQFVADARPFELIKMRVLNAAQSTLSHLGALVGHDYSYQAIADPILAAAARRMLERETASTLPRVEGMAVAPYIESSLSRIANTAIRHRCHQIGTDGSQKINQRILGPLRERLAAGLDADWLKLATAAWIAYGLAGARRFGQRWTPSDPWGPKLVAIGDTPGADFSDLASAALGIEPIFGTDLATPTMIADIGVRLRGLLCADPRAYLAGMLADG